MPAQPKKDQIEVICKSNRSGHRAMSSQDIEIDPDLSDLFLDFLEREMEGLVHGYRGTVTIPALRSRRLPQSWSYKVVRTSSADRHPTIVLTAARPENPDKQHREHVPDAMEWLQLIQGEVEANLLPRLSQDQCYVVRRAMDSMLEVMRQEPGSLPQIVVAGVLGELSAMVPGDFDSQILLAARSAVFAPPDDTGHRQDSGGLAAVNSTGILRRIARSLMS